MINTHYQIRTARLEQIPAWCISGARGFAAFVSALALAEMENKWLRISAAQQRALFGFVPFGKRAILSDGNTVRAAKSICFGTDLDEQVFTVSNFPKEEGGR